MRVNERTSDPYRRRADESPAAYESRVDGHAVRASTSIDGGELAWRVWGDRCREPLVLLHGGFGSWRHWIANVGPLSQHFAIYAPDLPGLGDSDDIVGDRSAEAIAAVVVAGVDELLGAGRRFAIAGFSFGGIITGHVAAVCGARAAMAVVIGSNGLGLGSDTRPELEKLDRGMTPERIAAVHRTNLERLMFCNPSRIDDLAVYLQVETVRLARARSGQIPWSDTLAHALRRATGPIAGIWGENDVIAGRLLYQRRELFESIRPGVDFRVIPDAGHWVMYEQPDAFNAALIDVLAEAAT